MRAAFSPSFNPKETSENNGFSLPIFVKLLIDNRFIKTLYEFFLVYGIGKENEFI